MALKFSTLYQGLNLYKQTVLFDVLRSFNETARDDCELTEEQAANMRFVPEGEEPHTLLTTDPTLTISNRVKEIADLVEKQLIEDDVSNSNMLLISQ